MNVPSELPGSTRKSWRNRQLCVRRGPVIGRFVLLRCCGPLLLIYRILPDVAEGISQILQKSSQPLSKAAELRNEVPPLLFICSRDHFPRPC